MDDRYALLDADGNVTNVILWDGKTEWEPPEGHTTRRLNARGKDARVAPGWRLDGGTWAEPDRPEPAEPAITDDEQRRLRDAFSVFLDHLAQGDTSHDAAQAAQETLRATITDG